MKIWVEEKLPHQTLGFEMPKLPGQPFRLVLPELISDDRQDTVPWSQPSPAWTIEADAASYEMEIAGKVKLSARMSRIEERVTAEVWVTNLTDSAWDKVNAFTCFAYYTAPAFDDPELARTFFRVDGRWVSVGEALHRRHDPGPGRYTFFPVHGGPALSDLWVARWVKQNHPTMLSHGCGCALSRDGRWLAGMATPAPAYLFNNRKDRCIHADPLLGRIDPGQTVHGASTIDIFEGGLEEYEERLNAE